MQEPNTITINIKNYYPDTGLLEISISSDVEDIGDTKLIAYQLSSYANTDVQNILKSIALSGLYQIRKEIRHREVTSNNEVVSYFNSMKDNSVTFNVSDLENIVKPYPVSNTVQEVVIS